MDLATLPALDDSVAGRAGTRGVRTRVRRMVLAQEDRALSGLELAYRPLICLVTHGAKVARSGDRVTRVDPGQLLVNLVDVPVTTDYEPPFRSVTLEIDLDQLAEAVSRSERTSPPRNRSGTRWAGIAVADADAALVAAFHRWVELSDEDPENVDVLAPLLEQELLLRVLMGPAGAALRSLVASGGLASIRAAAQELLRDPATALSVDDLARRAGMSATTFYRRFREATGLTPGQFHKTARLRRARTLLSTGERSATQVAVAVGYVSASQFTRDYRRQYGAPPATDARRIARPGSAVEA